MGHDRERARKVIRRTRDGVLRLVYGINWGRAGTIQVLYTVHGLSVLYTVQYSTVHILYYI